LGATVVTMGLISLPAMLRSKYSQSLATGSIAASGTLGQIIPPSIVLIILADQLGSAVDQANTARQVLYKEATGNIVMPSSFSVVSTSAGEMFLGALIPGIVLVVLYIVYILLVGLRKPYMAPSVPFKGKIDKNFFLKLGLTLLPPLALIFIVLGSIILGVATVNQAGAVGTAGAIIMAGHSLRKGYSNAFYPSVLALVSLVIIFYLTARFEINIKSIKSYGDLLLVLLAAIAVVAFLTGLIWSAWRTYVIDNILREVMVETAKTTSMVFIILLGAAMLTAAFRAFGGEELVRNFLVGLPGGFWSQFIIVMLVIFILGFFLDFIEIAVVIVPIVAPILLMDPAANVTAVWLGVMIGINIQTSFLTPPFGFALFYLRGIAPAVVRTVEIYKGVVPFIILQLLALVTIGSFPSLVNYLPNRNLLISETAPPPRNPALQYCLEEYKFSKYDVDELKLREAIDSVFLLDISALPEQIGRSLKHGFNSAKTIFERLQAIRDIKAVLRIKSSDYRPLHQKVRAIQKRIRKLEKQIKRLKVDKQNVFYDAPSYESIVRKISNLQHKRNSLESLIPEEWADKSRTFLNLQETALQARQNYRRAADTAYVNVVQTIELLSVTEVFLSLGHDIEKLGKLIDRLDTQAALTEMNKIIAVIRRIGGARDFRSAIVKLGRELRSRTIDKVKVRTAFEEVALEHEAQLAWRLKVSKKLLPGLIKYKESIRGSLGLRQQPHLPRDAALYIALCRSKHRDISLYF
ncbi:MAG: TRAP transporter large permease subunit, partial [Hyphomicrobiaceae bacterium]|nr:TRAP transporter large permease subunit [Hyphomicrobiaceae bacterium]